jgi:hypothetical protein
MAGDRDSDHLDAVRYRSPAYGGLVRGRSRNHEPNSLEPAGFPATFRQDQVPDMDRVERPAEQSETHRYPPRKPL